MPCRSPLQGYKTPDGKIQFGNRGSSLGRFGLVTFRCGMCRDCRLYRAREWAIRAHHEGQLHKDNCFIDLTFKVEPYSVCKRDLQLFFKRLRKSLPGVRFKYFAVGEYGEKFSRPHYHVCIFGWKPKDLYPWRRSPKGTLLHRSPHLETVWTAGYVTVSELTGEAAGYAARYTLKKITGDKAQAHYGERHPEFNLASNGLAKRWIEKYWQEVFRNDHVIFQDKECPVPRYYTRWLEKNRPGEFEKLSEKRKEHYASLTYETGKRLHQSAIARDHKTRSLARTYEAPEGAAQRPATIDRSKPNRPLDGRTN